VDKYPWNWTSVPVSLDLVWRRVADLWRARFAETPFSGSFHLTWSAVGEWTQSILRWLGPVLFGVVLLSLRGRVKR
jgi:hypothetical protein